MASARFGSIEIVIGSAVHENAKRQVEDSRDVRIIVSDLGLFDGRQKRPFQFAVLGGVAGSGAGVPTDAMTRGL